MSRARARQGRRIAASPETRRLGISGTADAVKLTRLRWLMWALFKVTAELERMFPGRSFMPEGRVADAVAQGIAETLYGVGSLLDRCADASPVLIVKAAQGGKVWLDDCPEHLLVLRLFRNGSFEEVYNGPGERAWALAAAVVRRSKGPWAVRLPALREAMQEVPDEQRLARIGAS